MKKIQMFVMFVAVGFMACQGFEMKEGKEQKGQSDAYVAPDNMQPDLSKPDLSAPDTSVPDTYVPDTFVEPDQSQPDIFVVPDLTQPDLTQPDNGPEVCVPDCTGKACGDDGCGGSCEPGCKGFYSCVQGLCVCTPGSCVGDGCQVGACDEEGLCVMSQKNCDDGNVSTTDSCNPDTGECIHEFVEGYCLKDTDCTDSNPCTVDVCDSITHKCKLVSVVCNDGIACTVDTCVPLTTDMGACNYEEDDTLCPKGQMCDAYLGCVECQWWYDDCDDENPCTTDSCDEKGMCKHAPKSCDDQNACTTDSCDAVTGQCSHVAKDCSDGSVCTVDSCNSGTGVCLHTAISCDDGNSCTTDTCDMAKGCVNTPIIGCGGCTPNCSGKVCGDNGCGGSCGSCAAGQQCQLGSCVVPGTTCGGMTLVCPLGTTQLWFWSPNGEEKFSGPIITKTGTDWWVASCEKSTGPWLTPSGWSTWPECKDIINPQYGVNCHNGTGDPASGEAACFGGVISPGPYANK